MWSSSGDLHTAAQPQHSGLAGEVGSGTRLKKKTGHYPAPKGIGKVQWMIDDLTGQGIKLLPFFHREIFNINQII